MKLGIDVGSTTVKLVLLNAQDEILYQKYERHMSSVFDKVRDLLIQMQQEMGEMDVQVVITGSGGLALADKIGAKFEQEVITCSLAVQKLIPETDVVIELGGEDAKITYFGASVEQRMNGTCAGGTGAFIDQMASLLDVTPDELDALSLKSERIYPIASRCGVFAKSDIQPLLNQGARKEARASILNTSSPLRTPPSANTFRESPTSLRMSSMTSQGASEFSTMLPPWLEIRMP